MSEKMTTEEMRDRLEEMVSGIKYDSEAKDKLAKYAEDELDFKVNRRKSVSNIIDDIMHVCLFSRRRPIIRIPQTTLNRRNEGAKK